MSEHTSASAVSLLQEAVALHQRGQLDAARTLYERVLERAPAQFDAQHLLGVIAKQQGNPGLAVQLIERALDTDPAHAGARCNLGAALQDLGRVEEALACYEAALQLDPTNALAYSNRGNALRKLGRLDDALASYERALAIRPQYPEAWCNRAMVLQDLRRAGEALASADKALSGRPAYADAWCARGNALQGMERFREAVESYDRALAIESGAQAYCSRGTALKRLGRLTAALESYDCALALKPGYGTAHHYRANTLRALGRNDEAIAAYRQALALGADAGQVGFALAALGEGAVPDAPPAAYVRELFDQYAGHFDRHLVDELDYRTPSLLGAAIGRAAALRDANVLDLGCGTGLMGPYLRPFARTLAGVDLSDRMLDKARERAIYDQLECAEVGQYLDRNHGRYELVAAADVLVYFGELGPLFARVRRALRHGGLFCFSVEACDDGDFVLRPSNRYAHSQAYLRRVAQSNGLLVCDTEAVPLRTDNGAPVPGYLLVLRADDSA